MPRSPDELLKLVADVVSDVAGVPLDDIQLEKSLVDDLDVDSLAIVEIMVSLEEKAGVSVPDDQAKKLKTVGDIVTYLAQEGA